MEIHRSLSDTGELVCEMPNRINIGTSANRLIRSAARVCDRCALHVYLIRMNNSQCTQRRGLNGRISGVLEGVAPPGDHTALGRHSTARCHSDKRFVLMMDCSHSERNTRRPLNIGHLPNILYRDSCVYMYIYMHIYMYVCMFIYMYVSVCMYVCVSVYVCLNVYASMYA